jgi:dimethylglycine dehydrogenase
MRLFGFRALITMRLEKNFGTWYREYRPIYTPLEAGMERAMKFDHEFIGRAAVEAEMKNDCLLTIGQRFRYALEKDGLRKATF